MKHLLLAIIMSGCALFSQAQSSDTVPFGKGWLVIRPLADNAVRIQYAETHEPPLLPEWIYSDAPSHDVNGWSIAVGSSQQGYHSLFAAIGSMQVRVDTLALTVEVVNPDGQTVFAATSHQLRQAMVAGESTREATLTFRSPADECLFGLGQFQDGYTNLRGLSRRLTQVNTQISVPMLLSSKGYGVLWNNYGLTDFNPADSLVRLSPSTEATDSQATEVVNVTSTEGGKKEVRQRNLFQATVTIAEAGDYALLLDVGQQMARRHNLSIDGKPVIEMQNLWLPPTTSTIVSLTPGSHTLTAELSRGDQPVVYYKKVDNSTVFRSPVAQAVDYTVFVGSADEIIAAYRKLTGPSPLMPQWALGYIHCRERFHSQDEILQTARRFRDEQLPADVMVQDWQYWGRYGWNSMQFDEQFYPDPRQLTDSLHAMNMRLMVSVWSKIDKNSDVGRTMLADGHYIPDTDWIDFFSSDAAAAYWREFSRRLVPLGIDAWWQDATEPENDDLVGRRVNRGQWAGELVRNVYPLLVNKTVYEGLTETSNLKSQTSKIIGQRPMILTRCGFAGIQRYGAALWSGDVGNDWETFRRQIAAGLGLQAAGIPWWTYDAGGFFRPGDQYTNPAYIERMLRWIETSVFLPLMRVHGYMSNTEPWNYGPETQQVIGQNLRLRYRLLPYIYSHAADVSYNGSTLMRPLVFDFSSDPQALRQQHEYMFGHSFLVSPVTEPSVTEWRTYLPQNHAGWYDFRTNTRYDGGRSVTTTVDNTFIPVFVRAGSIVPLADGRQYAAQQPDAPLTVQVYPGADATFTLYEDDGHTTRYQQGECSRIVFTWDDARRQLTISRREGRFDTMPTRRQFIIQAVGAAPKTITYNGRKKTVSL
ncbi:MAG: DUF5110 domain-containing protein [Prevotella sp.]|nr:DUF5110 domain-containing protein [Prevotella sp.]